MSARIRATELLSGRSAILAGSLLISVAGLFAGEKAMSIEKPKYTVVYSDGDVEYRQYEPYLVAETVIAADEGYSDAGNEGFRRLFRYITGANTSQAKIAMTVPVEQGRTGEKIAMTAPVEQGSSEAGWTVSFMVPSKYSLDSVPKPTDPRIRIRQVSGELRAVLRYSGRWTSKNFAEKSAALSEALAAANVEQLGDAQIALYNAPFTPPFLRRNEIHVRVDRLPLQEDMGLPQRAAATR